MRYLKKNLTLFLIGILSLLLLLYLTHGFSPSYQFTFANFHISILIPFFLLFFCLIFGLIGYILKSKTQGILLGLFSVSFLLLRYYHFTHWFFFLLLFIIFILTEIIFLKTK